MGARLGVGIADGGAAFYCALFGDCACSREDRFE
jgi:hypothetical protein